MKIEPITSINPAQLPNTKVEAQVSPRERAIQALLKGSLDSAQVEAPKQDFSKALEQAQKVQNNISEETSSAPVAETKAPEEPISSQYAILARKEKAIRQREQQLRAREAAIKEQESKPAVVPAAPVLDESKYVPRDRLTSDPFTVLNELGLSYDQLTEMALNAPKPEQMALMSELKALKDEIKALKGETENNKKSFEEQQTAQRTQAIKQITSDVTNLVKSDPQFEAIRQTRSVKDVVELIEKTFDEDGIYLSVEDAASQVEEYLVEESLKLAKLKKIQQRMQQSQQAATKPSTDPKQQQQMKTLTNSVNSSRPLTARERALLAFENKLK